MIAHLVRVRGQPDGRLALVRRPVGFMTSLDEKDRPVFAWEVVLLGAPAQIGADARREIIVADACLRPVSQVDPSAVEALIRAQVHIDVETVLADLARIVAGCEFSTEDLERASRHCSDEERELRLANEILKPASAFSPKRSSTAAARHERVHRPAP